MALARAEHELTKFELEITKERPRPEFNVEWPTEWTGDGHLRDLDASNPNTVLVRLFEGSEEWQFVENEWFKTGDASRAFSGTLLTVDRVQNKKAFEAYYSRVRLLASRNKSTFPKGTSIYVKANEHWMKHGTSLTKPEVIYNGEQGLDCRFSGPCLFGIAAYTAEDASYSHGYRYDVGDGTYQMFLVRVAAGNIEEIATPTAAQKEYRKPSPGFDSVRGYVGKNFKAIMVYQPDLAYPAYLLTYRDKV